jgi:hypothetical protein
LPVVDKRLIGRKFWANFGSLPGFDNIINFASSQGFGKWDGRKQWLNKCVRCTSCIFRRCLRHSFWMPSSSQVFHNFSIFTKFRMSHRITFSSVVSSTDASRGWTLVSTHRSWFSSHRSWDVKWFSKQSAVMLAFSFRWYVILEGPWRATGAFGPFLFINDFAIGHRAWGVTSQSLLFPTVLMSFYGPFFWWFWWPNWVPFYMLDPGLLSTVSLTSAYIWADSADQIDLY